MDKKIAEIDKSLMNYGTQVAEMDSNHKMKRSDLKKFEDKIDDVSVTKLYRLLEN